jgi:hypothetical protein
MLFRGARLRMIHSSSIQDLVHVRREKLLQMRTNGTFQGIYDSMNNRKAADPLSQIAMGYSYMQSNVWVRADETRLESEWIE